MVGNSLHALQLQGQEKQFRNLITSTSIRQMCRLLNDDLVLGWFTLGKAYHSTCIQAEWGVNRIRWGIERGSQSFQGIRKV